MQKGEEIGCFRLQNVQDLRGTGKTLKLWDKEAAAGKGKAGKKRMAIRKSSFIGQGEDKDPSLACEAGTQLAELKVWKSEE